MQGRSSLLKSVDQVTESVGTYGIMSIPTLMLFKDGNPMETLVGVQPRERLEEVLTVTYKKRS